MNFTPSSVGSLVLTTIRDTLGNSSATLDQDLADELDADSFDLMNIVAEVEERLDVAITEEDAARITTGDELVEVVLAGDAR